MAKTLLMNRVNGKRSTYTLPTDSAGAQSFAETFLDGEYAIYDLKATVGSDLVAVAPVSMNVVFWNEANPRNRGYATIVVPASKTENDVFAAMIGLTLNGIHITDAEVRTQRVVDKF